MPWVPELDDLPQTHLLRGKTKFISFSIFWEIKKFMKKKKEFHDVRELSGHYFCETLFNKRILLPTHNLSASFLNEGDFSDSSDVSVGMKKLMRSPQTFQWYSSHSLDYIQEEIISFLSRKKKVVKLNAVWTCIMWNRKSVIMEKKVSFYCDALFLVGEKISPLNLKKQKWIGPALF